MKKTVLKTVFVSRLMSRVLTIVSVIFMGILLSVNFMYAQDSDYRLSISDNSVNNTVREDVLNRNMMQLLEML